jgi:hypothetical protein
MRRRPSGTEVAAPEGVASLPDAAALGGRASTGSDGLGSNGLGSDGLGSAVARDGPGSAVAIEPEGGRIALEDERDFCLRSLRDLEAEWQAGDIDPADYRALKDSYTSRAAAVLRQLLGDEPAVEPSASGELAGGLAAVGDDLTDLVDDDLAAAGLVGDGKDGTLSEAEAEAEGDGEAEADGDGEAARLTAGSAAAEGEAEGKAPGEGGGLDGGLDGRLGSAGPDVASPEGARSRRTRRTSRAQPTWTRNRWTRRVLIGVGVAIIAGGVAWSVAASSGTRLPGEEITGQALGPQAATQSLQAAQQAESKGDDVTALKDYQKVLAAYPNQPEALTGAGWILAQTQQPSLLKQGLTMLLAAETADPTYAPAHLYRGVSLLSEDNYTGAIPELQWYLAHDPDPQLTANVRSALQNAEAKQAQASKANPGG